MSLSDTKRTQYPPILAKQEPGVIHRHPRLFFYFLRLFSNHGPAPVQNNPKKSLYFKANRWRELGGGVVRIVGWWGGSKMDNDIVIQKKAIYSEFLRANAETGKNVLYFLSLRHFSAQISTKQQNGRSKIQIKSHFLQQILGLLKG